MSWLGKIRASRRPRGSSGCRRPCDWLSAGLTAAAMVSRRTVFVLAQRRHSVGAL